MQSAAGKSSKSLRHPSLKAIAARTPIPAGLTAPLPLTPKHPDAARVLANIESYLYGSQPTEETDPDLKYAERRIVDAEDRANSALAKASGIVFVMSQAREPELISPTDTGNALWALRDLIRDAQHATQAAHDWRQRVRFLETPESMRADALSDIHHGAICENQHRAERSA